jgi:hypothetical protein
MKSSPFCRLLLALAFLAVVGSAFLSARPLANTMRLQMSGARDSSSPANQQSAGGKVKILTIRIDDNDQEEIRPIGSQVELKRLLRRYKVLGLVDEATGYTHDSFSRLPDSGIFQLGNPVPGSQPIGSSMMPTKTQTRPFNCSTLLKSPSEV